MNSLFAYLETENNGNLEELEDFRNDLSVYESHHLDITDNEITYTTKKTIKKKHYQSPNDVVYEASAIVQKDIIQKFKKYMNAQKVTKRISSEYVYNFDELCYIIDTLAKFNSKHKVWFKEVPDMKGTYELNFEELL